MYNKIKTSVIGSYPIKIDTIEIMNNYFKGEEISWDKYIKHAVNDMINAGIDIISDGQTRDPFIQIFTRKLKGCRIRDRTEILDKIEHNQNITIDDQIYVRNLIPKKIEIAGILTGPYTLTKSCIDQYYNKEKDLAYDFAYALKKEADILQKHADIISIDEPFFSNEIPNYGKELIGIITKKISCPTRLHACGNISKIIPDLLDIPVDILSHEFKATPQLFEAYKEYNIDKKICLGSIRSDDIKIESVDNILSHVEKGLNIFGEKIVQIAPDCGQKLLPRKIAFQKLKNLVKVGEIINAR
jgi:5-methyltetrahydropteroyltriglutamate--homocysteine methyltransferase